jgi:hypothetical protein
MVRKERVKDRREKDERNIYKQKRVKCEDGTSLLFPVQIVVGIVIVIIIIVRWIIVIGV